jgi:hypothetical protein
MVDPKSRFWIDGTIDTPTMDDISIASNNPLVPNECYKPTKTIHKNDIKQMILVAMHYHDYPEYIGKSYDEIAEQIFTNGIKL